MYRLSLTLLLLGRRNAQGNAPNRGSSMNQLYGKLPVPQSEKRPELQYIFSYSPFWTFFRQLKPARLAR